MSSNLRKLKISWKTIGQQALFGLFGIIIGWVLVVYSFQEFIQVIVLAIGLIFLAFGLIALFGLIGFPVYYVSETQLVIKSVFRKSEIERSSITGVNRVSLDEKSKTLFVVAGTKQFSLSNDQTPEFGVLEEWLRDLTVEDVKSNRLITEFIWIGVSVLSLPIVVIVLLHLFSNKPIPKKESDLTKIEIVLLKEPRTGKRGFNKRWELVSTQSPDFKYLINTKYPSKDDMLEINQGDTIGVYISTYDLQVKLKRVIDPTWIDKHLNWNVIRVYGIEKDSSFIVRPKSTL